VEYLSFMFRIASQIPNHLSFQVSRHLCSPWPAPVQCSTDGVLRNDVNSVTVSDFDNRPQFMFPTRIAYTFSPFNEPPLVLILHVGTEESFGLSPNPLDSLLSCLVSSSTKPFDGRHFFCVVSPPTLKFPRRWVGFCTFCRQRPNLSP